MELTNVIQLLRNAKTKMGAMTACALKATIISVKALFSFYKKTVFAAQAEYSYFSVDFKLKFFCKYSQILTLTFPF